jgi:Transposase DDE domain/Transposase domain (DUF772)
MTLGLADRQGELFNAAVRRCEASLPAVSIYRLLHRERDRLFPDELFADLFTTRGRRSIPPSIVAVVMVLQRLEGCSDREAVDRFAYDLRWRYAAGVADETVGFAHTVLVDMRSRLRASADPDRIFRVTTDLARQAGLVGVRRVLDSAPLYDAVATQDTVTLVRAAIRGLLRALPAVPAEAVRGGLGRDDDYATAGKPVCDWDDPAAREALVDALVRDGRWALGAISGAALPEGAAEAAALLATVLGQDVERRADGTFGIARRVAEDRVISVADPQSRHGHKTAARGFDGYKGHVAVDPDAELITAAEVGPAAASDAAMSPALLADLAEAGRAETGGDGRPVVYGDAAYGSGEHLAQLAALDAVVQCKVAAPSPPGGDRFAKDRFDIDLADGMVTCPAGVRVAIVATRDGGGLASFGPACAGCPLRQRCTTSKAGRQVRVGPHEALLAAARARQRDPAWWADYRAHRPKVERKLAHLLRRRHGGRRARVRGLGRVGQDWRLLAAAVNLARLAVIGVRFGATGWEVAPTTA